MCKLAVYDSVVTCFMAWVFVWGGGCWAVLVVYSMRLSERGGFVVRVMRRYYTRLFVADVKGKPRHDQYVHVHSNCACVLGITRWHALVTAGSPVCRCEIETPDARVGLCCVTPCS